MGANKSSEPSPFGLAVRAEILAEMGRRQMNILQLTELVPRGKSYLYERLSKAEKELALSDVESICDAFSIPIAPLMERAERAVLAVEREEALRRPHLEAPENYALAAQEERQLRPGEEEGVEYYE